MYHLVFGKNCMGKILSSLILGKTIPTKITNNQKILYCLTQEWTNKTIEDNFGEILPVNKISNLGGGGMDKKCTWCPIWGQKVYLSSKPLHIIPFWKPEDHANTTKLLIICFRTVLKILVTSVNIYLPWKKIFHVT